MSQKEIKEYIEKELKKEVPKVKIEEELSKRYREGLYRQILDNYPEAKILAKYKRWNNLLIIGLSIVFLIHLLTVFLELYNNYNGLWLLLMTLLAMPYQLVIPLCIFYLKKGYAIIYTITIILGTVTLLQSNLINLFILGPLLILSYYLKKKIHPNFGWFRIKKK